MASSARKIQSVIQVVLAIVIIGLAYLLYTSIVEPYAKVERAKQVTEDTRARMDNVRTAMIMYERENDRFVTSLDSLISWLKADSLIMANTDSVFGAPVMLDSLPYSPRTGNSFTLQVNDTSDVKIYLLEDPDSNDSIGSLISDITLLNASNWE